MRIGWESAGATHVGRVRKANEDSYRIDDGHGIFVVADGMGGHAAGEVASAIAADTLLEHLRTPPPSAEPIESRLTEAYREAQRRIAECCDGDPRTAGMGTTLTAARIQPNGTVHIGHLGDSRLYRYVEGSLTQVTVDHTWVQREVDEGRLQPKAARSHPFSHILTRVLTASDPSDPDVIAVEVSQGEGLLICSDGLYNLVADAMILEILEKSDSAGEAVESLIETANRRGGNDNITAINVRIR